MVTSETPVRVRFAPSPTGFLHIGGARTALFNWLFARHMGGKFILRIEDTDETRSTDDSVTGILESMSWLGLDWDEGPLYTGDGKIPSQSRGEFGPYFQMQRLPMYQEASDRLIKEGNAYPCYCTSEEVDKMREIAQLAKRPPKYDGTCRNLNTEQRKAKEAEGRKKSIRFKTPHEGHTRFTDLIRGPMDFENVLMEDFIILEDFSGVPTYNFACVIDDAHMQISHVIRGDDHLSNTPRQALAYQALGLKLPEFAHLAMILGSDGARLSKRHGATSVTEYRDGGYLPEVILNYLALLGWGTEDSQQLFTQKDMIEKFSLERCGKSPSTFDPAKLLWMNGEYLRAKSVPDLLAVAKPFLEKAGVPSEGPMVEGAIALEREKAKLLTEVPTLIDFLVTDKFEYREEAFNKVMGAPGARDIVEELDKRLAVLNPFDVAGIETLCKTLAKDKGVKNGAIFHPLRVAVSGRTEGPSLWHMIEYLGKERTLARIRRALSHVGTTTA